MMNSRNIPLTRHDFSHSRAVFAAAGFLGGSCLLTIFSFCQKIIAGFDPLIMKSYIVPFFFGGVTGVIITVNYWKLHKLNRELSLKTHGLENFLPTCAICKKIREIDKDPKDLRSWHPIENYISERTSSKFTHSICPECMGEQYPVDVVQQVLPGLNKSGD